MPSSIPYDPSLVLGQVVHPEKIDALKAIANAQKPIDDAQRQLNALILSKRSLDMTMQEMINMNVDSDSLGKLGKEIDTLKTSMAKAAVDLAATTIKQQETIRSLRDTADQQQISDSAESPMDYNKSAIKQMPLAADSLILDAQYFRNESEGDDTEAHANAIASYVSAQASGIFAPDVSTKMGASAKNAAMSQTTNHAIEGTLVITANATHKIADVFAPFVLDPDKAIRAWNMTVKGGTIDTDSAKSMQDAISGSNADKAQMYLLSGASYGSSFVGMVHILQTENTTSSQSASSTSFDVEVAMSKGAALANYSGKFGVDGEFSSSVKSLLSTSDIQSHASLVAMGVIPSIKSNLVTTTVQTLKPDPTEVMQQLSAIQGSTASDMNTMNSAASASKEGQSFIELNNSYIEASVSALGQIQNANNKVIDTNSMMTAFEDYIDKAIAGNCGVPINFYLKPITSKQLAEAWVNKYYPGQYEGAASGDDTGTGTVQSKDS